MFLITSQKRCASDIRSGLTNGNVVDGKDCIGDITGVSGGVANPKFGCDDAAAAVDTETVAIT